MKLKQVPEDFIVAEINKLKVSDTGKYCAFLLKKKGWNTMDAVNEIATRLGISPKDIRYAGLKDKEAVTEQLITINLKNQKLVERLKIKDVGLEFLGMSDEHTQTTDNLGNKFIITIRDIDKKYSKLPKKTPNYFDEQRFGNNANNHLVGKLIIKKQFKEACELLNINVENNDYVGALKNTGLTHIYFSAYQSYLFNQVLSSFIMQSCKKIFYLEVSGMALAFPVNDVENIPELFPLISFDAVFENEKMKQAYEELLQKDGINLRDFAIKQFPNLVTSSPERQSFIDVEGFKVIKYETDDLNKTRMKETLEFSLPRGSYATIVIKLILQKDL